MLEPESERLGDELPERTDLPFLRQPAEKTNKYHAHGIRSTGHDIFLIKFSAHGERANVQFQCRILRRDVMTMSHWICQDAG